MDAASRSVLRTRLIEHEGIKLTAYPDSRGFVTQGVGHLLSVDRSADPASFPDIDMAQAMAWLDADMAEAEDHVSSVFSWYASLDGARQGVLVEMVFQMGLAGLFGFTRMLSACRFFNFPVAAAEMRNSEWHEETPDRCEALARIMETGEVEHG